MSNYYCIHTAEEAVPCSDEEFTKASQLLHHDGNVSHGFGLNRLVCESPGEFSFGIYLFAEEVGDIDELPGDFCAFIGELLTRAGERYLQVGYALTCSKLVVGSHAGGYWRLMADGSIEEPIMSWPSKDY